jgi:hypothetical protein
MRARAALAAAALALAVADAQADRQRSLPDYRYFRALSFDLAGRAPTRDELAAFEAPDFDLDAWIESHLGGAAYAERLRGIYMDLLRLELGPTFQFVPNPIVLRRQEVIDPDGRATYVYFRRGQRRVDAAIDGDFCLTEADTGQKYPPNAQPIGTAHAIARATWEAHTVEIAPWWLYADYKSATPADHYGPDWKTRFPGFALAPALTVEPDGKTPTARVRVCREEAQTPDSGTIYVSGRAGAKAKAPPPAGRLTQPPGDSGFAKSARGRAISCRSGTGFSNSVECGCGVGLERCLPAAGPQFDPPAFVIPTHVPLGVAEPFEETPQPASAWERLWWSQEAVHFLDDLFTEDRDFRGVLGDRATLINGPLAQFYRDLAGATCCGPAADLGYSEPEPLFDPGAVPAALGPSDTATWMRVPDRGPRASGILTMPIFLTKYGSRRARAHAVYSAFLCKDFVADQVKLAPSDEPDLTKRPGCSTCHQTLEPMAAYFTRVAESDWTYLPQSSLPMSLPRCAGDKPAGQCKSYYDPAFSDATHSTLRGAYASTVHAELGPSGLAADVATSPEFAPCVVEHVAQAFLGRPLDADDAVWKQSLVDAFVSGGYRMRALVRAIVESPEYRDANDTASSVMR